jgi:hypothetical protein
MHFVDVAMRGIAMMTSGWGHCIQMPSKDLLDHVAKHNPCLIWGHEMVPFLKRPDVETGGEEDTDDVASEVQSKMIFMGHQILSCHVPVVRSFFNL